MICNLGNGEGFSVLEMIEAAREVMNHPIPVVISPQHKALKDMIVSTWKVEKQKMNK